MPGFNPIGAEAWADFLDGIDGGTPTNNTPSGSGFYYRRQRTAARLLKKYATGTVILEAVTRIPTNDPIDPYTNQTVVKTVNAYVGGYSTEAIGRSNGLIDAADRRVVVDSTGLANFIKGLDRLKIDGVYHSVVNSKPVPAAGTVSVYVLQARSAN